MKIEYIDVVKVNNTTLYTTIPKKIAQKGGIMEDDNIRVIIEKIEGGSE